MKDVSKLVIEIEDESEQTELPSTQTTSQAAEEPLTHKEEPQTVELE